LAGVSLIAIGVGLLVVSAAFFGYMQYTTWQLSNVVTVVEAASMSAWEPSPSSGADLGPVNEPKPLLPAHRIIIDSIELDSKVIELGTHEENGQLVWDTPAHAVGWYKMTAVPGQGSNVVMSGHISSPLRGEGSIFRRLPEVEIGDVIVLETATGQHSYGVVSREVVPPTAVNVMAPTPSETVTLITCYPDLIYSHRLVVQAQPIPS
jgi:LPXTG-site transpeptidase (sortase) family protein